MTLRSRWMLAEVGQSQKHFDTWFAHAILGVTMPAWAIMFARIIEVISTDSLVNEKMKSVAAAVGATMACTITTFLVSLAMLT